MRIGGMSILWSRNLMGEKEIHDNPPNLPNVMLLFIIACFYAALSICSKNSMRGDVFLLTLFDGLEDTFHTVITRFLIRVS